MPDQLVLVPAWALDTLLNTLYNAGYITPVDLHCRWPDPIGIHHYQPYYARKSRSLFEPGCGYNGCGASQSSPVHFT